MINKLPNKLLIFLIILAQIFGVFYFGFAYKNNATPQVQAATTYTYYLPLVQNDTQTFQTDILVQRIQALPNVTYKYYGGDGSRVIGTGNGVPYTPNMQILETGLNSLQGCLNRDSSDINNPDFPVCTISSSSYAAGFRGTAIFTSDQEINIIVRSKVFVGGGYKTTSYNATVNKGSLVFIPSAYRNIYGGYCSSFLNIVNVGETDAHVILQYRQSIPNSTPQTFSTIIYHHQQFTKINNDNLCDDDPTNEFITNLFSPMTIQSGIDGTITVLPDPNFPGTQSIVAQMGEAKVDGSQVYGFSPGVVPTDNTVQYVPQVSNGGYGGFYTGTDYINVYYDPSIALLPKYQFQNVKIEYIFPGSLANSSQCVRSFQIYYLQVLALFDNMSLCLGDGGYGFAKVTSDVGGIGCVSNVGATESRFGSNPCTGTSQLRSTVGLPMQGTGSKNPNTGYFENSGSSIANVSPQISNLTVYFYEEKTGVYANTYYTFNNVPPESFVTFYPPSTTPSLQPSGNPFDSDKTYTARVVATSTIPGSDNPSIFVVTNINQTGGGNVYGGWSFAEPNLPYPAYDPPTAGTITIYATCARSGAGIQRVTATVSKSSNISGQSWRNQMANTSTPITTDSTGVGIANPYYVYETDAVNIDITSIPSGITRIPGNTYNYVGLMRSVNIFKSFSFTFNCPVPFISVSKNESYARNQYNSGGETFVAPDSAAPSYTAFNNDLVAADAPNSQTSVLANDFSNGPVTKASSNGWVYAPDTNSNYDPSSDYFKKLENFVLSTKTIVIPLNSGSAYFDLSNLNVQAMFNSDTNSQTPNPGHKVFIINVDSGFSSINLTNIGSSNLQYTGNVIFINSPNPGFTLNINSDASIAAIPSHILIASNRAVQINMAGGVSYLTAGVVSNSDIIVGTNSNINNQLQVEGFFITGGQIRNKLDYSFRNRTDPALKINYSPDYYYIFKGNFISRSAGITDRTLVGLD